MSDSLDEIERVFLALSDKTRIKLVDLMRDGEVSVNYLCESLGVSQPKVSRHLAYLRTMGMVNTRRDGKWIYYRLSEFESHLRSQLLRDALSWVASATRGSVAVPKPQDIASVPKAENDNRIVKHEIYGNTDMMTPSNELEIYLL